MPKSKKKTVKPPLSEDMKEVLYAMAAMVEQADSDTPSEYRTRHFRDTMNSAIALLKYHGIYK